MIDILIIHNDKIIGLIQDLNLSQSRSQNHLDRRICIDGEFYRALIHRNYSFIYEEEFNYEKSLFNIIITEREYEYKYDFDCPIIGEIKKINEYKNLYFVREKELVFVTDNTLIIENGRFKNLI